MTLKTAPHSNTKFKEFFSSLYLFFCAFFFATKLILCIFCPFPKAHTYLVFSSALANMTKRWNLPEANQTHKVCVGEPGEWLLVALGFLYHTDSSASPIHSAFGSVQQLAANSVLHCSPGLLVALICTCRHPAAETNQQDRVYIQKHPSTRPDTLTGVYLPCVGFDWWFCPCRFCDTVSREVKVIALLTFMNIAWI